MLTEMQEREQRELRRGEEAHLPQWVQWRLEWYRDRLDGLRAELHQARAQLDVATNPRRRIARRQARPVAAEARPAN